MTKIVNMTIAPPEPGLYSVHPAHLDVDGLHVGEPSFTGTLAECLIASLDVEHHGDDGAAIRRPDGSAIYSAAEYAVARGCAYAKMGGWP
jgi:hypothetical protein